MAGSNSQTRSSSSSVDAGTRQFIEDYRKRAANLPTYETGLSGLDRYFNPYNDQVLNAIRGEGDRQASYANQQAADQATRAGAYGGSREAVLRGQLVGDAQRTTANNVASYSASGYQDAANRLMQDRQFGAQNALAQLNGMTPGFTPTSQSNTETLTQHNSLLGQVLGLGATVAGGLIGVPAAAVGSAAFRPNSVSGAAPYVNQGGGLNFGNYGGGYSFGGQGGWQPTVFQPQSPPSRSGRYW